MILVIEEHTGSAITDSNRPVISERNTLSTQERQRNGRQRFAMSATTIVAVFASSFVMPTGRYMTDMTDTAFHRWFLDTEESTSLDIPMDDIELESPKSLQSEFAPLRSRGFVRVNDPRKSRHS